MLDIEQMIDDKPNRFVSRHPVLRIKALKVDRARVASKRALAAQVEISIEIAQRQFAQAAIHGLAPAASGIVRFGDRAPAAVLLEYGDNVIGIVLSLEVEDQR